MVKTEVLLAEELRKTRDTLLGFLRAWWTVILDDM